ncbi:hypothetical protein, partial [Hyphococcus sp.]|uniref:hypothetical protein n=1 Tax=Hyphococcus sp. TaxID=2038636 RepID=UPI003752FE53
MWRITNILLLVFLVFALVAGGYVLYDDHLQYMDWGQDDKASRERTLNANETVDEEGRKLRTQAISFGTVLRFEPWGPWSVVTAEQSALATPLVTSADTIIVTGTRKGGGLLASAPNIYSRFTNNLVLRNGLDDSEKLLFTHKVAITNILAIPREQFPGIVA